MSLVEAPPGTVATSDVARVDAPEKVTGEARYAYEHLPDDVAYAVAVSSTVAKGRIAHIATDAALARPETLAVLTHDNAPRLPGRDDAELAVLQSAEVAYHGQLVAAVVATTLEAAVEAAEMVAVEYEVSAHDVVLRGDHPRLYAPEVVNPSFPTDSVIGDVDAAMSGAVVSVDVTYSTPSEFNNPMEPHATIAWWDGPMLTLYDSVQGSAWPRAAIAAVFGIDEADVHIVYPYVGGGFGSKGMARPQAVMAALAARVVGRPVKLAVTRRQMFTVTGYRTPTIQRLRLGADEDGTLLAIAHDVWEQTSTVKEFAEQTSVATRHLYAAPNRRTTHRLVALDVPTPSWMRGPGTTPGVFALECAMDELAERLGLDPIELRVRNEPTVDPEGGQPFSSRHLVECFRTGAARFGWQQRRRPGRQRDGRQMIGTGVASSIYGARALPSSARATLTPDGHWLVEIDAADIGTGARTALLGFAAERAGVAIGDVTLRIADSQLPPAMIAGGSTGTASWTWAIGKAIDDVSAQAANQPIPSSGLRAQVSTDDDINARPAVAGFSFGAQFAEVRVDVDTAEIRVPRLTGVFAAGRILNARLARSQITGAMTMGISMALFEEGVLDPAFGDIVNHDLAQYHVAANADVGTIDVAFLDEHDETLGPAGAKGLGEIGIVGTAAAIANAVYDATGVRVRDLPIRLDKILAGLPAER
jgi:xanthine dehydrogenase YagR molybdenum-binding subunit